MQCRTIMAKEEVKTLIDAANIIMSYGNLETGDIVEEAFNLTAQLDMFIEHYRESLRKLSKEIEEEASR